MYPARPLDVRSEFGIGNMPQVPRQQVVNSVHRRQRNVQGIGPGTIGKSGERLEFRGESQCALGNIDQRQNTGDCEPALRRLVVALARLLEHQLRNEECGSTGIPISIWS